MRLEREVSGVEQVQLDALEVASIRFGARHPKYEVALSPNDQGRRLIVSKVGLPLVVTGEVAGVIRVQGVLNVLVSGAVQSPLRMLPRIGAHPSRISDTLQVLLLRIRQLEQLASCCAHLRCALMVQAQEYGPYLVAHALGIGIRILNDERTHALRRGGRNTKAHGAAKVLDVERIALQANVVGEMPDYLGEALERIFKFIHARG